jgi:hypothetical protein
VGAGLFGLGETLGIDALDRAAAATMNFNRRGGSSRSAYGSRSVAPTGKNIGLDASRQSPQQQNSSYLVVPDGTIVDDDVDDPTNHGKTDQKRIARHGRPPSRWLRSLNAEELSEWLKTVNPPQAGVSGMTYWTHLTRDHLFDAEMIDGLRDEELAKLHAAAHAGY